MDQVFRVTEECMGMEMEHAGNVSAVRPEQTSLKKTKGYLRILSLLDEGSFYEIDAWLKSRDGYAEAVTGSGTVNGCPVYVFSQNSEVGGGAMSKAQASKIRKLYDLALKTGAPVVGIYDSNGTTFRAWCRRFLWCSAPAPEPPP